MGPGISPIFLEFVPPILGLYFYNGDEIKVYPDGVQIGWVDGHVVRTFLPADPPMGGPISGFPPSQFLLETIGLGVSAVDQQWLAPYMTYDHSEGVSHWVFWDTSDHTSHPVAADVAAGLDRCRDLAMWRVFDDSDQNRQYWTASIGGIGPALELPPTGGLAVVDIRNDVVRGALGTPIALDASCVTAAVAGQPDGVIVGTETTIAHDRGWVGSAPISVSRRWAAVAASETGDRSLAQRWHNYFVLRSSKDGAKAGWARAVSCDGGDVVVEIDPEVLWDSPDERRGWVECPGRAGWFEVFVH